MSTAESQFCFHVHCCEHLLEDTPPDHTAQLTVACLPAEPEHPRTTPCCSLPATATEPKDHPARHRQRHGNETCVCMLSRSGQWQTREHTQDTHKLCPATQRQSVCVNLGETRSGRSNNTNYVNTGQMNLGKRR